MLRSTFALTCLLASSLGPTLALAADGPAINDRKMPGANDVKMKIYAAGNLEPMNATIRQSGPNATIEIVEGGGSPAKTVDIVTGTCAKPGPDLFRLPPFSSSQYVATAKNADVDKLQDGNHALVIWSSNGKRRTMYACGDLDKPNGFIH